MSGADDFTRLPKGKCPYCGHTLNAAGTGDGSAATPTEGDATVCINCAQVMFFGPGMTFRKPRAGELETMLLKEPEWANDIATMQARIRSIPRP